MPPQPLITAGLSDPQIQDQQFAGALQSKGAQIPFSQLEPGAGANLTPPVDTGGVPASLPEWNRPPSTGSAGDGHKKALLQKLMSNLLSKPGRSMHEIINGVKDALGAYKNYAKEWDNLNGMSQTTPSTAGPSSGGIQDILKGIQQKKDGGGGPGYGYDGSGGPGVRRNSSHPLETPRVQSPAIDMPRQLPMPREIPHQMRFINQLPLQQRQGIGNNPRPLVPPQRAPLPDQLPLQQRSNQLPMPMRQAPIPMPMGQRQPMAPQAIPPQRPAPIMPPDMIAGQPQASSFNRPAPVSNLGVWGY